MDTLGQSWIRCSPSSAEWGCSEAQEQWCKACLEAPGQERGGLTCCVKAIAEGGELSSVRCICLRVQGEQFAVREDGEPAQMGSGPNLLPLMKSAMSTKMSGSVLSPRTLKLSQAFLDSGELTAPGGTFLCSQEPERQLRTSCL